MRDEAEDLGDPIDAWLAATAGGPASAATAPPSRPDDERRGGFSRRLLVLSAVPWIAVVALAATAVSRQTAALPTIPGPTATAAAPGMTPAPQDGAPADDEGAPAPAAAAVAVVALRTAAGSDEYIDTAAVEGTDVVGELTIVTLRAVRLVRSDGTWGVPQVIRAAVAVSGAPGEEVAVAPPWRLPSPTDAPAPTWAPIEDPQLLGQATAAAESAGYTRLAKAELRAADQVPGVVSLAVSAAAPGDNDVRRHEILLPTAATAVLGTAAAGSPPLPIPAEQP